MDFYRIETRQGKGNKIEVFPEYKICRSKDLMVRGGKFYVVYNEETGRWTTDKVLIQETVDGDIQKKITELYKKQEQSGSEEPKKFVGKFLSDFSTTHWSAFDRYVQTLPDNYKVLDQNVTFHGTKTKKTDYVSKELPYELNDGPCEAWNEMLSILYEPEEREKIEWAIGSILAGDAKSIQKFLVFYGPQGSGKSTILNIVMKLLDGYYVTFKAESLVSQGDQFGCKFLSDNPLVAIDEDTNLSRIETNATINKIASHEELEVNEKYKSQYVVKPLCMMMLGTNKPVRITDAKSGIIRRLIDIEPSGRKIKPIKRYEALNNQIMYELGAIANHCLNVYKDPSRGPHYYDDYIPERMMYRTDPFFNFMEENYQEFKESGYVSAVRLWNMWKDYCQQSGIEFTRKRYEIIDEAKNYFAEYHKEPAHLNGEYLRNYFAGIKEEKFKANEKVEVTKKKALNDVDNSGDVDDVSNAKDVGDTKFKEDSPTQKPSSEEYSYGWLKLQKISSLLDKELAEYPAQYEVVDPVKGSRPEISWKNVKTRLKNLDTSKTHWIKGPGQLIFIDFDKHGPDGKKDLQKNLKAAGSNLWKPSYSELSNSGGGIHTYYWYDGNVNDLSNLFDDEIEIKVFPEDKLRSIRRRVTMCNDLPIAHISSGLPLKETKMINWEGVKDDRHLRNMILQALKKECRPYGEEPKTVTCVKWICDILKRAQLDDINYDIRDLGEAIYAFAANSHNNKNECINMYYSMELIWPKQVEKPVGNILDGMFANDAPIIILDCEVVQNLTLVVYKELGPDKKCIRLFNPKSNEIEKLMQMRIVGHNVTGYDNYILWALWLGYTPEQVFQVSQDIIVNGNRSPWREAKNVSYTDTYDVSSDKKGLKKIEIEMHFPHKEMEIDWSKPLPESEWERLAKYCENDVLATEAYYMSEGWQSDFKARKILAALTGMTVNDSTNNLTAQLIFGDVKEPQSEFNYPDLREEFPEYRFENGKSYYGDELIGEGGRVYAEQGAYYGTITFDVAGMHPTTVIVKLGFGPYTQGYKDLYEARIAIKHKDYKTARKMFGGRLAPYLESDEDADALSHALKIALNSVYGMTAAHFKNRFKDPRNVDNWVAKRGALFMEKLRREVQARGGHVIHIKTDSIKLVQPSKELQDFVVQFGKDYGYTFEIESKYERICLVNHAVYIALRATDDPSWLKECSKAQKKAEKNGTPYILPTRWTATGAQFAHPFVFKKLFSKEPLDFWDFCEIKTVKTALYLDINEKREDVSMHEKERTKILNRIKKLEKSYPTETSENQEKITNEIKDLKIDISVLDEMIALGHNYIFVGKAGEFMPIRPGLGGGLLMRKEDDGSFGYATGAKGYRWLESENLRNLKDWKKYIDIRYFRGLVDVAIDTISKFCDFDMFVRMDEETSLPENRVPDYNIDPWILPCGTEKYAYCSDCPDYANDEQGGYYCKKGYDITNQILGESKEISL